MIKTTREIFGRVVEVSLDGDEAYMTPAMRREMTLAGLAALPKPLEPTSEKTDAGIQFLPCWGGCWMLAYGWYDITGGDEGTFASYTYPTLEEAFEGARKARIQAVRIAETVYRI
jgi:hypothetical protein